MASVAGGLARTPRSPEQKAGECAPPAPLCTPRLCPSARVLAVLRLLWACEVSALRAPPRRGPPARERSQKRVITREGTRLKGL